MNNQKFIYFSFQSSQNFEPTSKELLSFQRKYKKDFKTRELYEGEELLNEYRLRGWKHPRYSHIISIIIAFEIENNLRIRYITGNEEDILTEFNNILRRAQDYSLVTFDSQIILPFLGIRMARNRMLNTSHIGIKYKNMRPWDVKATDLQQYYDGAGNYKSSIKDIAEDLDLDSNYVVEIEDEFTFYNSGDFETLKKSAIQKVEVMCKAHRLLLDLSELEVQLVEETVKEVVEEKPKDWLKELYYANQMTTEIKEGLKQQIFGGKVKKQTKKELEHLFTIIRGTYVKSDFENNNQDNNKTIEQKEAQIKELLGL
jgi:hypothetical protein